VFGIRIDPAAQQAAVAAFAAASLLVAALGGARYRGTKDTSALFVSTAFLVLGVNALVFGLWWPRQYGSAVLQQPHTFERMFSMLGHDPQGPAIAWLAGWVVAGVCLLLTRPWWDRRGRPPIRPLVVLGAAAGAVVVLDLVAVLTYRRTTLIGPWPAVGVKEIGAALGPLGWVFALTASGLLIAAGVRLMRSRRGGSVVLAFAAFFAVPALLFTAAKSTYATAGFWVVDLLPAAVAAMAFVSLLVDQRVDTSRMRRASDRARLVMGGRAEIATMLGHEVKGPVATIRGLAGTSIAHYDRLSEDERKEFLVLIEQESRRLLVTVDQASLAMKVDAGTLTYDKQPVDLALVLRDAVDAADLGAHPLTMDTPHPGITATADRRWLTEALRQVLVNAAAFSPPDAPIRLTLRRTDAGTAAIEVIDAGPGIPEDQRERVFEKFAPYRPPGYEEATGTGLGLFLTRGIVTAHGGSVVVAGAPTGGTMLTMTVPVED